MRRPLLGSVDTAEGRFLSNLLATFYLLPYIDVGVVLEADDQGGITQVCGYVHYLQPGQSSLLSREAISMEDVRAEGIQPPESEVLRGPEKCRIHSKCARGGPAVISVNTTLAGMAVNELLARLHGFRDEPNRNYATIGISISQVLFYSEPESGLPCKAMHPHVGRGDVVPLLQQAELSE